MGWFSSKEDKKAGVAGHPVHINLPPSSERRVARITERAHRLSLAIRKTELNIRNGIYPDKEVERYTAYVKRLKRELLIRKAMLGMEID